MLKKHLSVIETGAMLLVCAVLFCGCKGETEGLDGYTFTDALGREVTVSDTERTAALIGSFAEVWTLAGGTVSATAEDAWEDFGLETDAVNIGGAHSPSLEKLLSAAPDFVIASASTASNVALCESLENAGITVAYFDVDSFEDYLAMLDICTDLTGRKDLYSENGLRVMEQIEAAKESTVVPEKERKILLLRASSGSVKAKGSEGTVLGEMLSDMGLINIADSDKSVLEELSIESIMKNEPYRIFAVTMGDDTEKAKENIRRMLETDPAWSSLEAVREGRVHVMDRHYFNLKPNSRWGESYEKLCEILG